MADNPRWYLEAACKDVDVDVFYGGTAGSNRQAAKFCAQCPVRKECLEDSLQYPPIDQYGLWGGISAHERRKILVKRNFEANGGAHRVCEICREPLSEDAHHHQKFHSGACRQEARRRLARHHAEIRRSQKRAVLA